jgi:predicted DNA binding CopG/RHH family protein
VRKKSKRDVPKVVRMSKEEVDLTKEEADKLGLSFSAYIRMLIHKEKEKSM